jgi:hypothetical protein
MIADAFYEMGSIAHKVYHLLRCWMLHDIVENGLAIVGMAVHTRQAPHFLVGCHTIVNY